MVALFWLAGTLALTAETIPVINHSFEQPELGTEGQDMLPDLPGWQVSGKSGVFANIGKYGKKMAGANREQLAFLARISSYPSSAREHAPIAQNPRNPSRDSVSLLRRRDLFWRAGRPTC